MSVPIPCPRCECDHLHASVSLDAEHDDRFEVLGIENGNGTATSPSASAWADEELAVVRVNPVGVVKTPDDVHLHCCACDWNGDRVIRSSAED